jgi:hypothetical protein
MTRTAKSSTQQEQVIKRVVTATIGQRRNQIDPAAVEAAKNNPEQLEHTVNRLIKNAINGSPDNIVVEIGADALPQQQEVLEDPEAYAWELAAELCNEIIDEIVDEKLHGWQDDSERAEVMTEIASLTDEIRAAAFQAIWEELENSQS